MSQRIVQEHHSIFNFSAVYDKVLEEMRKKHWYSSSLSCTWQGRTQGQKKIQKLAKHKGKLWSSCGAQVRRMDWQQWQRGESWAPRGFLASFPRGFTKNNIFLLEVHHFAVRPFSTLHYASPTLNRTEYLQLPEKRDFVTVWTSDVPL